MNSICGKHQKDAEFKCCLFECSQIMCKECLIHPHQDSPSLFYCDSCASKNKTKSCIVLCQPVTNGSFPDSSPVQAEEHIQNDLSTIRVQLFPSDNQDLLQNETNLEEHTLAVVPGVDSIIENVALAQTMNQSETYLDALHLMVYRKNDV